MFSDSELHLVKQLERVAKSYDQNDDILIYTYDHAMPISEGQESLYLRGNIGEAVLSILRQIPAIADTMPEGERNKLFHEGKAIFSNCLRQRYEDSSDK